MAIIYVSEHGGMVTDNGIDYDTRTLEDAVSALAPDLTIILLPGRYTQPVTLSGTGSKDKPITLKALRAGTVTLDGRQPVTGAREPQIPDVDEFAFFKIVQGHHIILQDLNMENCWPTAIFLYGSKHITVRGCAFLGGQFCLFATNGPGGAKTRHIVMEDSRWIQDPDHDMWKGKFTWYDIKQEPGYTQDASHLNGAFFGSNNIKGPITIRHCDIAHAFNAIRIDAKEGSDPRSGLNADIVIVNNKFSFIRDNAIEPEALATRLWILNNSFFNVHAAFSFDGVGGSHWYIFGNQVLNIKKPGRDQAADDNRGGKIFKFDPDGPYPHSNIYFLFNSVQTRTAYWKKGHTRHLVHKNNVIGICRSGPDCDADRQMLGYARKPGTKKPKAPVWHDTIDMGHDLTDFPSYPDAYTAAPYEYVLKGYHQDTPLFDLDISALQSLDPDQAWNRQLPLAPNSMAARNSDAVRISWPNGQSLDIAPGHDMGAPGPEELFQTAIQRSQD